MRQSCALSVLHRPEKRANRKPGHNHTKRIQETFKKEEPKAPKAPKEPEAPKNDAIPTVEELNDMKAKELVEILVQMGVKATTFMGKPKLIDMVLLNSK